MARQRRLDEHEELVPLAEPASGPPESLHRLDSEIASLGDRIIAEEARFAHLRNFEIAWLMREAKFTDEAFQVDRVFRVRFRSDDERALARFDVKVIVHGGLWNRMDPATRRAGLTHALKHISMHPESGKPVRIPHDAEVFADEFADSGAWHEGMRLVARNAFVADPEPEPEPEAEAPRPRPMPVASAVTH